MGRKKKFEKSRSRSFLLPTDLLSKLEECAEMRGLDVSEVVHDLLDGQIVAYHAASRTVQRERSLKSVTSVQGDSQLAPLFEKYRGKKNPMLPLSMGLKKGQVILLMEALEADRVIHEDPPEEKQINPLLAVLVAKVVPRYRDLLRRLDDLLDEGDGSRPALDIEEVHGVIHFVVPPPTVELIGSKIRDDEGIDALITLTDRKVLLPDGMRDGRTLFRVSPSMIRT